MFMKPVFVILLSTILFTACGQNIKLPVGSPKAQPNEAVATFSEGCFWHAEIIFQSLDGVRDAVSGYAGGTDITPDYEKVSTGRTGHAETVQVYYDPSKISYETLVKAFFASQDPTTLNRQGNDAGTEYRSIAFYRNEKEKQIILAEIKRINDSKMYRAKVVTEVVPYAAFYPAENYHQEYASHNQDNPYVTNVTIPDYMRFRKQFKGKFKAGF